MEHATEQYHLYTCMVVYKHMQIHTFIQSSIFVKILKLLIFFSSSGCLVHEDGTVLKPVQVPPKGQTEVEFYQEVFGEQASTDKVLLQLRELVPKFHGIVHAPKEPDGKDIHV